MIILTIYNYKLYYKYNQSILYAAETMLIHEQTKKKKFNSGWLNDFT